MKNKLRKIAIFLCLMPLTVFSQEVIDSEINGKGVLELYRFGHSEFIMNNHNPVIWSTKNTATGNYPFTNGDLGHLVLQPRTSATRDILMITGQGDKVRLAVKGSGNIGIGTTEPFSKLEVDGDISLERTNKIQFLYDDGSRKHLRAYIRSTQGSNTGDAADDYNSLVFGVGNKNEAMKIDGNGRVGIGTSNPNFKLDVKGIISNGASDFILGKLDGRDQGTKLSNRALVHFSDDRLFINYDGDFEGGVNIPSGVVLGSTSKLSGNLSNGPALAIGDSDTGLKQMGDGKLGVFTNNVERLRVDGAGIKVDTGTDYSFVRIGREAHDAIIADNRDDKFYGGGYWFRVHDESLGNKYRDVMILSSSGNVGIGVRNPQNKLSVNGTIWAKEVKVSLTDAADWVFEEDYDLKPLSEVKKFVQENKHLPEIPSAEEFRKEDLKVSEMTNKLLQKIEELTLYTIEQEEKLEAQEYRIKRLENLLIHHNN
ncbi:hypothetical protein ACXGQW_04665 [Wenyingzhuangia sp. IMCC45533]